MKDNMIIVVRGAGDLASGTIIKLHNMGFRVAALECEKPSAIRREVALSDAIYYGQTEVEGVTARLAKIDEIQQVWDNGEIPIIIDPTGETIKTLSPFAVVDAILAKKNLGTTIDMAPITVGLGPGFEAGVDVSAVVETMRGPHLGRIYYSGEAIPNTGIPGKIAGYDKERVLHSPCKGQFISCAKIGDVVSAGDVLALVDGVEVKTSIDGVIRGMLPDGFYVSKGFKIADVDPRMEQVHNIHLISDKARCIAGAVVEAIFALQHHTVAVEKKQTEKDKKVKDVLGINPNKHRLIAVVGAGGKTSLIYQLASELREEGYRVAVTTTTHIQAQGRKGFEPLGAGIEAGKIVGFLPHQPKELLEEYDIVLVEADGSRHHPLKVPAEYEPVIPDDADLVIGVAGTDALGKTFEDACHRWQIACEVFGVSGTERITYDHIRMFLNSTKGQKKNVICEYIPFINDGTYLSDK